MVLQVWSAFVATEQARRVEGLMGVKINIQEFIKDYCAGVKDKDLLAKHKLNAKELIALVRKLINDGHISKEQYFDRNRTIEEAEAKEEKAFLKSLSHCPVCGHIHPTAFTVCPACGTDITKLEEEQPQEPAPSQPVAPSPPPSPPAPVSRPPVPQPALTGAATLAAAPAVLAVQDSSTYPDYLGKLIDSSLHNVTALPDSAEDFSGSEYVVTEISSNTAWSALLKAEDMTGGHPPLGIKLFHPEFVAAELFDEVLDRIVSYQAGMSETNVTRILGRGELEGRKVLLYESMPSNLERVLIKNPEGLSLDLLMTVLPQILNAVGYSHMHRSRDGEVRRVPHWDLRLSKFQFDESSYLLKLEDCGVWRALTDVRGHKKKVWEEIEADLSALAPECFVQDSKFVNGFNADVYSVGIALYRLATGRSPFVASTVEEYHHLHLRTYPIPPRVHRYTLPAWLDAMILKCLEKEPAQRWRSATQMELSIGKSFSE